MRCNLYGNILLQKNISLLFFHIDHNLENNDENVSLILEINRGLQVACSRKNSLKDKKHMCSFSILS